MVCGNGPTRNSAPARYGTALPSTMIRRNANRFPAPWAAVSSCARDQLDQRIKNSKLDTTDCQANAWRGNGKTGACVESRCIELSDKVHPKCPKKMPCPRPSKVSEGNPTMPAHEVASSKSRMLLLKHDLSP